MIVNLHEILIKKLPSRIGGAAIDLFSFALASIITSPLDILAKTPEGLHKITLNSAIVLFSLFLNKDIFFGKSIGKYFSGLRVVSTRDNRPAKPIQCAVRNFSVLLWPVEALFILFSPNRRLGDWIAGTKLIDSKETSIYEEWRWREAALSIAGSLILIYFLFNFIDAFGILGN